MVESTTKPYVDLCKSLISKHWSAAEPKKRRYALVSKSPGQWLHKQWSCCVSAIATAIFWECVSVHRNIQFFFAASSEFLHDTCWVSIRALSIVALAGDHTS